MNRTLAKGFKELSKELRKIYEPDVKISDNLDNREFNGDDDNDGYYETISSSFGGNEFAEIKIRYDDGIISVSSYAVHELPSFKVTSAYINDPKSIPKILRAFHQYTMDLLNYYANPSPEGVMDFMGSLNKRFERFMEEIEITV